MSKVTVNTTHGNTASVDFDAVVNLMDSDILETKIANMALETEQETVDVYARLHMEKFGAEFIVN